MPLHLKLDQGCPLWAGNCSERKIPSLQCWWLKQLLPLNKPKRQLLKTMIDDDEFVKIIICNARPWDIETVKPISYACYLSHTDLPCLAIHNSMLNISHNTSCYTITYPIQHSPRHILSYCGTISYPSIKSYHTKQPYYITYTTYSIRYPYLTIS